MSRNFLRIEDSRDIESRYQIFFIISLEYNIMSILTIDIVFLGYSYLANYVFSKNNEYKFFNLVERHIFSIKGGH